MLDWFKRVATAVPQEQLIGTEKHTLSTEEKVERLVGRLAAGEDLVAWEDQPVSIEKKLGQLVARLGGGEGSIEMQNQPLATEEKVELPVAQPQAGEHGTMTEDRPLATEEKLGVPFNRVVERSRTLFEPLRGLTDMRIIVVASQKGGCGKTTIAAHLAVQAGMAGDGPAVLVDADWQGSLTAWWRARNDDALALATVTPGEITSMGADELAANLTELRRRGFAVAIIDTPPARTAAIEQVIANADLVLIPARPSPHDLRAVGATVDMARRSRKPFLFVVNGAAPRANITAQAVAALSEFGPVAPVILFQRIDYAASMIDGRTAVETAPSGRSAQEITELWKHVYSRIRMRAAA